MANPRQRRKARSSTHRPVKTSRNLKSLKKQPPIRGPKVLQDSWDKHKTVRQNYEALGLAHTLTPCDSGGREARADEHGGPGHENVKNSREKGYGLGEDGEIGKGADETKERRCRIPRGFGKIIRDEEGNVVEVEFGEDEMGLEEGRHGRSDLMEGGEKTGTEIGIGQPGRMTADAEWVFGHSSNHEREDNAIIEALEKEAKERDVRKARTVSEAEEKYLRVLVRAYGEDVEKMSRDRKRNAMQYTSGQLRRAICSAGGYERLGLGLTQTSTTYS